MDEIYTMAALIQELEILNTTRLKVKISDVWYEVNSLDGKFTSSQLVSGVRVNNEEKVIQSCPSWYSTINPWTNCR